MKSHLLRIIPLAIASAVAVCAQSSARPASTFNLREAKSPFITIDYPGSTSTQIWGVNARDEMVGVYIGADKVTHGFLFSGGRFTSIDYPGAAVTFANGINARGDIVGEFGMALTGPHRGFLLSNGRFTPIDFPGADHSAAFGITAAGDIFGGYMKGDTNSHCFMLSGDTFTKIDYPDAPSTVGGGVSPQGDILAAYTRNGIARAFMLSKGEYTTWVYPGANFTNALARNAAGDIVGRYRDTVNNVSHGYLLSRGEFTSFDFPGASFTGAAGITPDGDIVGRYTISGVSHGFLYKRSQQPRYTVTDLGTLGGKSSVAYGINDSGSVAGVANLPGEMQRASLWRDGRIADLGTLGGHSNANNANGANLVSIVSEISKSDPDGEDFCQFGTHLICVAAMWHDGKLTALPTLGGNNSFALFLNNRGQIAGVAEKTTRDPTCPAPQVFRFSPVLFGPKTTDILELRLPAGDTVGFAFSVNDRGEAVGGTGNCANTAISATGLLASARPVLWKNGIPTDLGTFGSKNTGTAVAINNRSEVIGSSGLANEKDIHGFLWTSEAGLEDLGTVGDDNHSFPSFINNSRQVTGASCDIEFNCRASLWEKNVMVDLNDLIAEDSPLYLLFATAINDAGEIVGKAVVKETGELHAFLATPANAAPTVPKATASVDVRKRLGPAIRMSNRSAMRRFGAR